MKLLKKYGWLIIIPIAIGAFIGYRMYHKPHFDMERSTPEYRLSAEELFEAYETDEMAADEKYLGKVVEVSGELQQIDYADDGQPVIRLKTGHIFGLISCELDSHSAHSNIEAQPGETIVIKGVVTGFLADVVLNRCIIIP